MDHLNVRALKTGLFHPGQDLGRFLMDELSRPHALPLEDSVLVVTSKIVSLAQSNMVSKSQCDKRALIFREAETVLGEMNYGSILTIKNGHLLPSSGIDESNSETGDYILHPRDPFASAAEIHEIVRQHFHLSRFGVVLSDSRTFPLRCGVIGISLAHYGFRGSENKIGKRDLFGAPLKMTQINVADALAAAAVLCMGESDERTPLALVRADVQFETRSIDSHRNDCEIRLDDDLYAPFFKSRNPE
jgi:F420-0:gamma-glutamyl ligase